MAQDPLITGMFRDRQSAERAYGSVTNRGYTKDDVSLLMSPEARKKHFMDPPESTELGSKAAEGAAVGAGLGAGTGALLAGLAALGIAVPGLPIIAMGPLAAAFLGGGTGALAGGILGALIGSGIPEDRAKEYDRGIREGGIVMGVKPRSDEDARYFEQEWTKCGAEQLHCPPSSRRVA